jgi:glycosyltransferase involved in cell wall biosynthesis
LNPFDKLKAYQQLVKIVELHGIEIVHAHHRTGGSFAECVFRRSGVPYVITVHDIWHRAPAKALHGRIFRRLIAVSGFIKKGLEEKFGIAGERIRVVHNGVDPTRIENAQDEDAVLFRRKFGIGGEVLFSLVARITKSKGHYDLVEALRLLPRDLEYRCLIVGEGRDKQKLQELVAAHGFSEKVIFCGFQSDIPVVMRASDVVMLPSHREPFAITILEAMFSRRPLLVSDSGGTPEAIRNGHEGIVFPARNAAALADGIKLLATDEGLRRRLGERAYRTAYQNFLLTRMIEETEAYYSEIVDSSPESHAHSFARPTNLLH